MHIEVISQLPANYLGHRRTSWRAHPVTRQWLITDELLRVVDAEQVLTWQWAAVATVELRPTGYLLRQPSGLSIDVPRAALTDAQDGELRTFLARRGLLPPSSTGSRRQRRRLCDPDDTAPS
jgi:hypothetical protein